MKKLSRLSTTLILLFFVMQSCIYDEEQYEPLPHGVQMGFTIRVAGNGSTSRGTDDQTETGSDLENMIDIENRDFRVYFYEEANDAYIGELEIISVLKVTDNDDYNNDYYVVGQVDNQFVTKLNEGFHMVVMANLRNWAVRTPYNEGNKTNICQMGYYPEKPKYTADKGEYLQCYHYGKEVNGEIDGTYNNEPGYIVSKDRLIPMWGCQTYNVKLEENAITQLTTPINMLRTLAKIEVNCNLKKEGQAPSNIQLESVAITNHRSCVRIEQLPQNPDNANNRKQYDETTTNHDEPNIKNKDADRQNTIFFTEVSNPEESLKKFILYLPEMYQTESTGREPSIKVNFSWDDEKSETVKKEFSFPVSSAGTEESRIPLLRNHIYRYNITQLGDIEYEVVDMSVYNIELPDYN